MSEDRNGVLALLAMLRHAFPDLHAVIHDQAADGDKVWTLTLMQRLGAAPVPS
jgi:hypothetical protein